MCGELITDPLKLKECSELLDLFTPARQGPSKSIEFPELGGEPVEACIPNKNTDPRCLKGEQTWSEKPEPEAGRGCLLQPPCELFGGGGGAQKTHRERDLSCARHNHPLGEREASVFIKLRE